MNEQKSTKHYYTAQDKMLLLVGYILLGLFVLAIIVPVIYIIVASFMDPITLQNKGIVFDLSKWTLNAYERVLTNKQIWIGFKNSIFYSLAFTAISVFVTLLAAFPMSRPDFKGKKFFNTIFVITMFFGGGRIPTFLVIKDVGLYNSPWVIILMGCVSVWNLMVARTFIQTNIPEELFEAAKLDGANHFQCFIKVVMPLSRTIIAVLAVYYGVSKWNDYFTGLVYLRNRALFPLQTILREILATLQVDMTGEYMASMAESGASLAEQLRIANVAKYCIIVVSTAPVVLLYAFMQKYFEKGIMIGSLKG